VIGDPAAPDPCTVSFVEIVPHNPTVTPGAIGFPTPQFAAVLKNETGRAFAQLDPSPEPACTCATYVVVATTTPPPPPPEQAAVVTPTDANPD
jgi:hypothetical protein